jgi:phosphoribosylaminoimidazole-succinocarboxamide synthase
MMQTVFSSNIDSLPLLARGKVRDNYAVGEDKILMIATDRISAFDVVMGEPIPGKGILLTQMALFWFDKLSDICPNHLTHQSPESVVSVLERPQVSERSMLVQRLKPLPIEAVVRGYLAGSAWSEYKTQQTACGIALPKGLKNASKLDEPIFTPATKAAVGDHDENISFEQTVSLIGFSLAQQVRDLSLALYAKASRIALEKGIIIADTKFEFGLNEKNEVVLMDEILTPDSSRYWPLETYQEGSNPPSYDKQFLRDWLESTQTNGSAWNKKAPAPALSNEVIEQTAKKYLEVWAKFKP